MSFVRRRPRLYIGAGNCFSNNASQYSRSVAFTSTHHQHKHSNRPLETHYRKKSMELARGMTFSTLETTTATTTCTNVNDMETTNSLQSSSTLELPPQHHHQQQQLPQRAQSDTLLITARKLLDQRIFPIGSYTDKHLKMIQTILDQFQNTSLDYTKLPEIATISLELLLRACKEVGNQAVVATNTTSTTETAVSDDPVIDSTFHHTWIWELHHLSTILKQWQHCRDRKLNVVDGKELFRLFQYMLQSCSGLNPKMTTMHVLMDCFVNHVRYKDGVHMALELLEILDQHGIGPVDEYLYSQVIYAWSMIHHAKTPGIMGKLIRTLHERGIPLTETSYLIVLRYWARWGQTQHLQELHDYMKTQPTTISSTANALLIEGYVHSGELEHAEKLFDEFRQTNALDEVSSQSDLSPLVRCAYDIIQGYQKVAVDSSRLYADREKAAAKAISLFLNYQATGVFSSHNVSKILATVIEMYGSAMQYEQIPLILWKLGLQTEQCHALIRELSPSRATDVLVSMLRIPTAPPNVDVFNTVLNAWAESEEDEEKEWWKRMFLIFMLMKKDPKAKELQVTPNSSTYAILLKGLAKMGTEQAVKCAKFLLHDIKSQGLSIDDNISMAVGWATLACLKAEQFSEADKMMLMLETPQYTPSAKIFERVLAYWNSVGTFEAARKADAILQRMHSLSHSNPRMQPTAECYSCVVEAWAKSGSEEAESRVHQIFYELKALKIRQGNPHLIRSIVSFLSQGSKNAVHKSDEILEELETNDDWGMLPSKHMYRQVLEAWLRYDDPDRAARIIIRISDLYIRGKNRTVFPTGRMLHLTAKAYLSGSDIDKAVAFLFEIQELADLGLLPKGPEYITWHTLRLVWNQSKRPRGVAINDKIESFMKALNPYAAIFQNDVIAKKKKKKERRRRNRLG